MRQVGPDGWRDVRRVRLRALADSPDAFLATLADEEDMGEDRWRARLERPDAATFLADGDAGIVTGVRSPHVAGAVELVSMWTAPEARRTGVGAALVEAVVGWARAQGAAIVLLDVAGGNDGAVRFYERCGFAVTDDPRLRDGMAVACDLRMARRLSPT